MFINKHKVMIFAFSTVFYALLAVLPAAVSAGDVEDQYRNSLNYYEKIKSRGAYADELISVLQRIISKYEPQGFDVLVIKEELESINKLKDKLPIRGGGSAYGSDSIEMAAYRITIGDMLRIVVPTAEEYNRDIMVQADGKITIKTIGEVLAKGLTKKGLSKVLTKKLGIILKNPRVDITIKKFSKRKIYLMGEVKRPGSYDYEEDIRLLELINKRGGVTDKADFKYVKLYRGEGLSRKVIELNLEEIYKTGDFSKDYMLEPGDVVEIGKSGKEIYVIGEVRSTGTKMHVEGMKLLELITISGGFTNDALMQEVKVFRGKSPNIEVFKVDMLKVLDENRFELDMELKPGDTVYVQKKRIAKVNQAIDRVEPWITLLNFGMMIALLMSG